MDRLDPQIALQIVLALLEEFKKCRDDQDTDELSAAQRLRPRDVRRAAGRAVWDAGVRGVNFFAVKRHVVQEALSAPAEQIVLMSNMTDDDLLSLCCAMCDD